MNIRNKTQRVFDYLFNKFGHEMSYDSLRAAVPLEYTERIDKQLEYRMGFGIYLAFVAYIIGTISEIYDVNTINEHLYFIAFHALLLVVLTVFLGLYLKGDKNK